MECVDAIVFASLVAGWHHREAEDVPKKASRRPPTRSGRPATSARSSGSSLSGKAPSTGSDRRWHADPGMVRQHRRGSWRLPASSTSRTAPAIRTASSRCCGDQATGRLLAAAHQENTPGRRAPIGLPAPVAQRLWGFTTRGRLRLGAHRLRSSWLQCWCRSRASSSAVNPACRQTLGRTEDELVGLDLRLLYPDDLSQKPPMCAGAARARAEHARSCSVTCRDGAPSRSGGDRDALPRRRRAPHVLRRGPADMGGADCGGHQSTRMPSPRCWAR